MTHSIQHIRDAMNALDVAQARSLLGDALKNPDAEIFSLASMVALYQEAKALKQMVKTDSERFQDHQAITHTRR